MFSDKCTCAVSGSTLFFPKISFIKRSHQGHAKLSLYCSYLQRRGMPIPQSCLLSSSSISWRYTLVRRHRFPRLATSMGTDALLLGSKIAHFNQLHKNTGIPYLEMVSRLFHWFLRISCHLFPSYFSTTRCGIERSSHWVSDPPEFPIIRHLIRVYYFNKVSRSTWCIVDSTTPASSGVWRAGELGTRKSWRRRMLSSRRRPPTLDRTQSISKVLAETDTSCHLFL